MDSLLRHGILFLSSFKLTYFIYQPTYTRSILYRSNDDANKGGAASAKGPRGDQPAFGYGQGDEAGKGRYPVLGARPTSVAPSFYFAIGYVCIIYTLLYYYIQA